MKVHKVNQHLEEIVLHENSFIIVRNVPSKIEMIEPKFPGDDRERKITEYKSETILNIMIPETFKNEIISKKSQLEYCDIEIEYNTINGLNILNSIEIYDLNELNDCW